MSTLDDLEARIAVLHQAFVSGLAERRAAIVEARDRVLAGRAEARAELAGTTHKLRGSAGSYGFDALSVLAARVEEGADRRPAAELAQDTDRLLAELDLILARRHEKAPAPAAARRTEAGQPAVAVAATTEKAEAAASAPSRLRVLALDDDEPTRRLLKVCLRPASGFETVAVGGWREALERATADRFDLVITDWMMPEGDGLSFARALSASGGASASSPVVILSAAAPPEELELGRAGQPVAWIQKPFAARALVERLLALAEAAAAR